MKKLRLNRFILVLSLLAVIGYAEAQVNTNPTWYVGGRIFNDGPSGSFDDIAVKDPTIVYSGGRYHMFYTGRDNNSWRMGYASATTLEGLNNSSHTYMSNLASVTGNYFCAPQVFYHTSKGQWYLIFQSGVGGATYSTNSNVGNPSGWSTPRSMGFSGGIDFTCIREGNTMYLFYAPADDSRTILRRSTSVANFPTGWSSATVVATNTFEGQNVYRNLADGQYYMIVEDIARHFELWRASSPGGSFTKLAEEWAHRNDIVYEADHWTDQISHGEVIRAGTNEYMEVTDLNNCTMIFQGVVDGNYGSYWQIPYDIGVARNGSGGDPTPPPGNCGGGSYGSGTPLRFVMRGTTGTEQVQISIGNNEVANFTLCTDMADYLCSTGSYTGEIYARFHNDEGSRDVQIDYVSVDGEYRQAEDMGYNTGVWQDGSCGGSYSEWLHCNGTIGFGTVSETTPPPPPPPAGSDVWLEAECGILGSFWNVSSSSSASNDQYITVQSGTNSTGSAPSSSSGHAVFDFSVSESGNYNVWARVITPSPTDDSFWVRMDGGSWFQWNNIGPNSSWAWEQAQSYNLSTGSHTLTVAYREDGAQLDKIYIGNSTPAGEGSAAANCSSSPPPSGDYTITVRARGTAGSEQLRLSVGGTAIQTWTLSTNMSNYSASTGLSGGILLDFINDDGTNRDVQVDYVQVPGATWQAEDQSSNTAVWQDGSCGGSYSEWMHCGGYIGFGAYKSGNEDKVKIEPGLTADVHIYPNPVTEGWINIQLIGLEGKNELHVIDMNGRIVKEFISEDQQFLEVELDINPGIYLLRVFDEDINLIKRLIVN